MRELGEGMRRIYDLMQKNELAAPELTSNHDSFSITLTNRAMYTPEDNLWLSQFEDLILDRQMKSVILLGRNGRIFSAANIWDAVGIVDTEDYRKLVEALISMGVLANAIERLAAKRQARSAKVPFRDFPRYKIEIPEVRTASQTGMIEASASSRVAKLKKPLNKVPRSDGRVNSDAVSRVFLAKIPVDASNEELYEVLQSLGEIADLKVPRFSASKTKGYAFVLFEDVQAAQRLLQEGVCFRGVNLHVALAAKQEQS